MPNWCTNTLVVRASEGYERELDDFILRASNENTHLSLESLHPYPNKWDYDWCLENWGTKWDVDDVCASVGDDRSLPAFVRYNFLTAWDPPIEAFKKVSADFPHLIFLLTYGDPGCEFWGHALFINGEIAGGPLAGPTVDDDWEITSPTLPKLVNESLEPAAESPPVPIHIMVNGAFLTEDEIVSSLMTLSPERRRELLEQAVSDQEAA